MFKQRGVAGLLPSGYPVYLEIFDWPYPGNLEAAGITYGVLAEHTSTPDDLIHLVLDMDGRTPLLTALTPTAHAFREGDFTQPMRSYHVARCGMGALPVLWAEWERTPVFSWPADRTWVLGGDVDYDQSYLAVTENCALALERTDLKLRRVPHNFIPQGVE